MEQANEKELNIPLNELIKHLGHALVFTSYGQVNYSLECEDCHEVIGDIDVYEGDD
jgi:hypothetical protein